MFCTSCFNTVNIEKNCAVCGNKHIFYLGGVDDSILQSVKDAYELERKTDLSSADISEALKRQKRISETGLASTAGSFSGVNKMVRKDERKSLTHFVSINNRPIGFLADDRFVYTFSRPNGRKVAIMHTIKFFVDRRHAPKTDEIIIKEDTQTSVFMPAGGSILFDKYCLVPIKDTDRSTGMFNYNIVVVDRDSNKVIGSLMRNNAELSLSGCYKIEHNEYKTNVRLYVDYKFGYVYINHGNEIFVYKFTGRSRMPFEFDKVLMFRNGNAHIRSMCINKETGALYVVFREELSPRSIKNSSKYKVIEYMPQKNFSETILLNLDYIRGIVPISDKMYYLNLVDMRDLYLVSFDGNVNMLLWSQVKASNLCYAESSQGNMALYLSNPSNEIYKIVIDIKGNIVTGSHFVGKTINVLGEVFEFDERQGQIIVKSASTNYLQAYLRKDGIRVYC